MTRRYRPWLALFSLILVPSLAGAEVSPKLFPLVKRSYQVRVQGGRAYVATTVGLRIVDVRKPASPRLLGTLVTPDSLNGLAVAGSSAYLAAGPRGVVVADVRDPRRPRRVAVLDTPGSANAITVDGRWLYVADGSFGVAVYDVANPDRAVRTATWETGCYTRDLVATHGWLFVACGRRGLIVLPTMGRPGQGRIRGRVRLRGDVRALAVGRTGVLYVAAGEAGLLVVNISAPVRPHIRTWAPVGDYARGVAALGNRVAVADGEAGAILFDVSAPKPRRVGSYRSRKKRSANDVELTREGLFIAYDADGLHLVAITGDGRLVGRAVFPKSKK